MPIRRVVIGFLAVALALLGALPVTGTPADQAGTTWHVKAGAGTPDAAVTGMAYYPDTITIDVGDSVTWTDQGDAHTVTFLSGHPRIPPTDPASQQPAGGSTYDGTAFTNSGIIFPGSSYTLTFTKAGTFPYTCLLHPPMHGVVIVQPAGTPYPMTQSQYDQAAAVQSQADLSAGISAMMNAKPAPSSKNADGSTNYNVDTGTSVGMTSVMRFLPNTLTISVGDTVTWSDPDLMDPHTVTFAPDGKYPEFGTPQSVMPTSNTTYDGSTFTNSGLIVPAGAALPGIPTTTSYTLKFTKPGVYVYHCLIHDGLGMIGKIRVVDSSGSTGAPAGPVIHVSNNPVLGPVLTDANGHTLYFLTSELAGAPTQCTGKCLGFWPPVGAASTSADVMEGPGVTGTFSVVTRSDGINQVQYGEAPLYTFAGDKAPGDINGEGIQAFGGVWLAAQVTSFPLMTPLVTTQNGGKSAVFVVSFGSSTPGQGQVYFGPSCSATVMVGTQDQTPGTTTHTVVVTGNDLPGTVGNNGLLPGTTYFFKTVTQSASGTETNDNGGNCYMVTIPRS